MYLAYKFIWFASDNRAGMQPLAVRLTAAEMKRCRWVKPSMVCQVKFTEWTRDDRLRQAVFLGIKEDKNSNEVVREKTN